MCSHLILLNELYSYDNFNYTFKGLFGFTYIMGWFDRF